jgi:hypothetical protein
MNGLQLIETDLDSDAQCPKELATLRAQLASRGYALHQLSDGYLACRWNLSRAFADLHGVAVFARQVGAR